ncbi:AfsR/SARP family transcriptional regulator [Streptomyces flavofungini]|uniref:AfsR/SARP family transcriptional regulator n=1 Tax=Streptomyces flavofungini TaxID=68200 RepID=UPI0025B1E538|nr:tetratricopeptide repeat protein [Streptomyces flavofungini]WJV45529.1 tetratricopeptide repeat protein [Streptomyces flavofungini]
MTVDLRALGPLELWQDGRRCELGSPKELCVLAVLVHARGEPVSLDTLMDRVWDDDPPRTAQDTLQSYLSRLRSRLTRAAGEQARLERYAPRLYRLRVAPDTLDLLRYRRLRTEAAVAARQGERGRAVDLLRAAESLWRGEPLTEFTGAWARSARARLLEDHRRVREERIRLELDLGRHADLIGELRELAAQNPLAQRVIAALMLALYRSGRDDEALGLYRATRARLRSGQGIEPCAELQELHLRILEQDRVLMTTTPDPRGPSPSAVSAPAAEPARATGPHGVASPADAPEEGGRESGAPGEDGHGKDNPGKDGQGRGEGPRSNLPRDIRDFTGRTSELRVLLDQFTAAGPTDAAAATDPADPADPADAVPSPRTSLPLTVIHGMPGVGKTALALHAAHRLHTACPDGQFYVDLRGYGALPPYDPAEALAVLLHAAGFTGELPGSLDARVTRWREWTARRRVLIVLDNARDAEQVRPLLPGAASCRVLVTSRNRLTGLAGATPLYLEVLSTAEAATLFTRVAGAGRLPADASALTRTVAACGRHPLALQLLASQFRHRDSWSLDHLTDRLVQAADPLEEFDSDAVASAFSLSYTELPPQEARLLRRLALHPGPDITLRAATALAAAHQAPARGADEAVPDPPLETARTRKVLDQLLDRNLVEEPVADRYRLHDLTRAFGLRMCTRDEPHSARRAALARLLNCYLTGAYRAAVRVDPHRRVLPPGPHLTCPYAPDFGGADAGDDGADEAAAWLSVERGNLIAVARAAAAQSPEHAVLFPHVLATSLRLWGTWDLAAELFEAAVASARLREDRGALARTLVEHADVLTQKDHAKALHRATEALLLFQDLNDVRGRADALLQSGRAHFAAGRGALCLRVLRAAHTLYERVDDPCGRADVVNMMGVALHAAGRHREALEQFRTVLRIHEDTGSLYGQLRALNNVGEVYRLDGRLDEARAHFERSLRLAHRVGGRQERANLLSNLGSVCEATGQVEQALTYFRRALTSYRAAGDARGESDTLISLGSAYTGDRRPGEALWHFAEAERIARSIGSPFDLQAALLGTGTALRLLGRYEAALDALREALRLAREVGSPLAAARSLDGLARTAPHTQDAPSARGFAEDALDLYEQIGCAGRARDLRLALTEPGATSPARST